MLNRSYKEVKILLGTSFNISEYPKEMYYMISTTTETIYGSESLSWEKVDPWILMILFWDKIVFD